MGGLWIETRFISTSKLNAGPNRRRCIIYELLRLGDLFINVLLGIPGPTSNYFLPVIRTSAQFPPGEAAEKRNEV